MCESNDGKIKDSTEDERGGSSENLNDNKILHLLGLIGNESLQDMATKRFDADWLKNCDWEEFLDAVEITHLS